MLCENCKEREATVHFTEIMNGRVQKHHLCKECAAQMEMMGYASNEVPFVKLLTGMLAAGQTQEQGENPLQYVRCPKCGMTYEEFTRVGKFGCAECIDVFGPLIGDHMKKLHGSDTHTGKTYTKEKMQPETKQEQEQQDIEALKLRLKEAVMLENFEAAAKYRDELRHYRQRRSIMLRWFEQNGPEGDVVISSRVRLARNLKDYNFSLKLDTPDAHKMIGEAAQKLRVLPEFKDFHEYHFENLEEVQREAMKERHVISPFLLSQSVAGGFVSSNEDLSIMLNEEDHIRIQAYRAGMDMERAYEAADHIDDCIGAVLPYAYDMQYGYLTTCPSNVGTGMRVSYMCHLPALAWNNKIQGIAAEIGRFGLVMHSVYSDGNKSAGDIYQISNQITLGITEKELIENITNIVQQIVTQERILRNRLKEKQKISVLDGIYRSYGILKYARKVSLKDGLVLLSQLRLGLAEGLVKTPDERDYAIYQLMIGIQPGNLEMLASQELTEEETDVMRAQFIRENLPSIE